MSVVPFFLMICCFTPCVSLRAMSWRKRRVCLPPWVLYGGSWTTHSSPKSPTWRSRVAPSSSRTASPGTSFTCEGPLGMGLGVMGVGGVGLTRFLLVPKASEWLNNKYSDSWLFLHLSLLNPVAHFSFFFRYNIESKDTFFDNATRSRIVSPFVFCVRKRSSCLIGTAWLALARPVVVRGCWNNVVIY